MQKQDLVRLSPPLYVRCLLGTKPKVIYATRAEAEARVASAGTPMRVYACLSHYHLTSHV